MTNAKWCRHYNGLSGTRNDGKCAAGVVYRTILPEGPLNAGWPCVTPSMRHMCLAAEEFTQAEIDEDNKRTAAFIENLVKLDKGEIEDCVHCGKKIESMRQVGRCVYASPCGCRLWQGKVPEAWK